MIVSILCTLIIFEFLMVPFPVSYVDHPQFYKSIYSDREKYVILEIPSAILNDAAAVKFSYYQTYHGKPIVGNHIARIPKGARDFELNTPLIRELTLLHNDSRDILNQDPFEVGLSILNYYNIKYITIHEVYMSREQIAYVNVVLNKLLRLNPVYFDKDLLIIYEVPTNVSSSSFISLSGGWHALENWGSTPTRWMENDATLMIYSDEDRTVNLSFKAHSFYRLRTLEIYVNNLPHIWAEVPSEGFMMVNVPSISLNEGANIVRFHVPEGCESPIDISELNNVDPRCLSVAVQNITIT